MTDNTDEMREAFPGVEVEQHQGDCIRRIVLPNSRLVNGATTRYQDALRVARQALINTRACTHWVSLQDSVSAKEYVEQANKALATINKLLGDK